MLKKFSMIVSVVALLTLALVGCKNGMLGEDDATVNGIRDVTEGRTANVTVTNYAGTGATRSAAGGSLRTIAPDATNLQVGFTFVAEGKSGRNVLAPTIVTLDATSTFDLPGLTPGVWSITLTAFDTAKLQGQTTDANAIKALAPTAAVLSGVATVDLTRSNGNARITLTPRNIGKEGTVTLKVNFNNNDQQKITGLQPQYKVEIGLYHRGTGAEIQAGGQTTVQDVTQAVKGNRLVNYDLTQVPVGEYTFKVTITNETDPQKGPWYWSDNLFVHGNMDTNQQVDLDELLGGAAPVAPENFAVYWAKNKDKTDPAGSSYTAHFAWDKKSYNESGFILEIADITEQFNPTNQQYDGVVVNSGATLWTQIEQKGHNDTITTITAANFSRDQYPIYDKDGTLLAGSTYVDYELLSGRLYTARICATNFVDDSAWVYLTNGGTEPASKWHVGGTGTLAVTEGAKLNNYYFDVFSVTYQLRSFLLLKQGEAANTAAVRGDVDYHAFVQGVGYTVKYEVSTGQADGKYQLYPSTFATNADFNSPDRNKSWKGWTNDTNRADIKVYGDTQQNTQYEGHTNVTLIPAGASNSLGVDVITAGTFKDLLTDDTVFIQLKEETAGQAAPQGINWADNNKWTNINTNIKQAVRVSQVGAVDAKKGISLPDTIQTQIKDYLCVTVGNVHTAPGKLTINTGNGTRETTVYQMVLTLEQNGTVIASGMSNPGDTYVYADVTTLAEGDYTLRLYALPAEGYGFSFQKPFVVKLHSTVIP